MRKADKEQAIADIEALEELLGALRERGVGYHNTRQLLIWALPMFARILIRLLKHAKG